MAPAPVGHPFVPGTAAVAAETYSVEPAAFVATTETRRALPAAAWANLWVELVDLGRAQAALLERPPRHAHGLEHPDDERDPVRQQREHQRPGRERGGARPHRRVLPCRRSQDDERERDAAGHGAQQRRPPLERVADRDEGWPGSGWHRQQAEPERELSGACGPGRKRSRREHQGQEPRTHTQRFTAASDGPS